MNLVFHLSETAIIQYRKIPIISPGVIFVQKAFSLGLFLGELIFGGACYRKELCVSKWVWFVNKNSNSNSPWAYIREGLLSEESLRLRFGGLSSGGLIYLFFFAGEGGLLSEFYDILITSKARRLSYYLS